MERERFDKTVVRMDMRKGGARRGAGRPPLRFHDIGIHAEVRKLALEYSPEAMRKIYEIMVTSEDEKAILSAANMILNRALGMPPQSQNVSLTDAQGNNLLPVRFNVTFVEPQQHSSDPAVIEGELQRIEDASRIDVTAAE
jgi:hypothetical protein